MFLFSPRKMVQHNILYHLANVWKKSGSSIKAKILSTNQIAGFFDHKYLWKELIDILDFLSHQKLPSNQEKVAPETTTLAWMWPVEPLV